jgi:hypothetical protein
VLAFGGPCLTPQLGGWNEVAQFLLLPPCLPFLSLTKTVLWWMLGFTFLQGSLGTSVRSKAVTVVWGS